MLCTEDYSAKGIMSAGRRPANMLAPEACVKGRPCP
jgi:hypothetical protein